MGLAAFARLSAHALARDGSTHFPARGVDADAFLGPAALLYLLGFGRDVVATERALVSCVVPPIRIVTTVVLITFVEVVRVDVVHVALSTLAVARLAVEPDSALLANFASGARWRSAAVNVGLLAVLLAVGARVLDRRSVRRLRLDGRLVGRSVSARVAEAAGLAVLLARLGQPVGGALLDGLERGALFAGPEAAVAAVEVAEALIVAPADRPAAAGAVSC